MSTLHLVFKQADAQAVERALADWADAVLGETGAGAPVAVDGKALRGTYQETIPGLEVAAADATEAGLVLAQAGVRASAHEGELTEAPLLMANLRLAGRVVTCDAPCCQRALCSQILQAGGDYLVLVKGNQPTLLADIELVVAAPPPGTAAATATQVDRGHGRWERRHRWATVALTGYSDWPGLRQVGKVERVVRERRRRTVETRYFVTSLGPEVDAARLLHLVRGHWRIENRLHWVRNMTFREDAWRVRSGNAPQILAADGAAPPRSGRMRIERPWGRGRDSVPACVGRMRLVWRLVRCWRPVPSLPAGRPWQGEQERGR